MAELPIDLVTIRRTCAEAEAVAADCLAGGVEPQPERIEHLRALLHGHLGLLMDEVRERYAPLPPGRMRRLADSMVALGGQILGDPERRGAVDLLPPPPVIRLLALMNDAPEVFSGGALPAPSDDAGLLVWRGPSSSFG
ncbi:DUF6415 family natural product biosynthesis protein [Streptomyces sp. NBC_00572]|uniref:DUF6415 family natural product biosynthesis protein n=1 Tax=Streptomyces sp. NBC_00572 TaxID=2903664 RepID=UPI00225664A8|nr:DUF6415 family natural product biosynthesis protein [Streptomyces sp. NBC_00572]MCX4986914.1 DUF6415 family natural product biosynthesis protein [Streptomyces sp. NBC_00572]